MAEPRAMEVVNALRRLGYRDAPKVGDHFGLWKLVPDHPDGPVTISTGLDSQRWYEGDLTRIKKETQLEGDLWDRALAKDLPLAEYNAMLKAKRKWDLVIPFFREKVKAEVEKAERDRVKVGEEVPKRRRPKKTGRRTK